MENQEDNRGKISRRSFMKSSVYSAVAATAFIPGLHKMVAAKIMSPGSFEQAKATNKRDLVLDVLDMSKSEKYIPAAFFMHFGKDYRTGEAAVSRHLEYFRATDMDFVKIQYELGMPRMDLQKPSDWSRVPLYGEDFFEPMLTLISGIVKEAKKEALIIPTLYSPFMCASQIAGKVKLMEHISEDPDAVAKGMEIITQSLMNYMNAAIRLGVDGFYTSTQGGEVNRIADRKVFDTVVRPFDLTLMSEADRRCAFNILHICDYEGKYESLLPYVNYPGKVVNAPISLSDGTPFTSKEAATLFKRPVMGGLNRLGEIAKENGDGLNAAVDQVLKEAPEHFIFGADCTIPASTSWKTLRSIIQQAHNYR